MDRQLNFDKLMQLDIPMFHLHAQVGAPSGSETFVCPPYMLCTDKRQPHDPMLVVLMAVGYVLTFGVGLLAGFVLRGRAARAGGE